MKKLFIHLILYLSFYIFLGVMAYNFGLYVCDYLGLNDWSEVEQNIEEKNNYYGL